MIGSTLDVASEAFLAMRAIAGVAALVLLGCAAVGWPRPAVLSPPLEGATGTSASESSAGARTGTASIHRRSGQQTPYREGELLVRLEEGVSTAQAQATLSAWGVQEKRRLGPSGARVVELPEGTELERARAALEARPEIAYAEPNYRVHAVQQPDDPERDQLWGLQQIQAPKAWDLETGHDEVVVAVTDTGIDYTHEDLAENMAPAS